MTDKANTITVNTWEAPEGVINQEVSFGIYKEIIRGVMDTREKQVREMLVKMGWTPPVEKSCKTCGENPENGPCPPDCIPSFSHWIPPNASRWGRGIPELLKDAQDVANAKAKHSLENQPVPPELVRDFLKFAGEQADDATGIPANLRACQRCPKPLGPGCDESCMAKS